MACYNKVDIPTPHSLPSHTLSQFAHYPHLLWVWAEPIQVIIFTPEWSQLITSRLRYHYRRSMCCRRQRSGRHRVGWVVGRWGMARPRGRGAQVYKLECKFLPRTTEVSLWRGTLLNSSGVSLVMILYLIMAPTLARTWRVYYESAYFRKEKFIKN